MTTPTLQQPTRHARAQARTAKLTGASKVRSLRVPSALAHRAELVVMRSGLPAWFEARLPAREGRATGGPKRTLEVRALLVGMHLLALAEQPLILRDVAHVLNTLHPSAKHRLGIPRGAAHDEPQVTERMISRLWNQMITIIDPSPHSEHNRTRYENHRDQLRQEHAGEPEQLTAAIAELKAEHAAELAHKHDLLRYVLDAALEASLPADVIHAGSYAIDSTPIATWATKYRRQNRNASWLMPDPDAARNAKPTRFDSAGWLGYSAHAIVRLPEIGGDAVPCLVERIDVTPADTNDADAGLALLQRMVIDHTRLDALAGRPDRPRSDVIADRAYTNDIDTAERWHWPLFDLGFDSHFDLTAQQLGARPQPISNGALVIDGQPFSPSTPAALRELRPPHHQPGATREQIAEYQRLIAERAKYSLHALGGRNDDGSWDFGCRAMKQLGHQLVCANKPDSLAATLTPRRTVVDLNLFQPRALPSVCAQQQTRIGPEELPYWQELLHGSREHYESVNRRNRVEGWFGNSKNSAVQDLNRGQIRVMGLAKTAFMTMIFAVATNMRLTDTFEAKRKRDAARAEYEQLSPAQKAMRAPTKRKPRYRTRKIAEMREWVAEQAQARQGIADTGEPPPEDPPDGELLTDITPAPDGE